MARKLDRASTEPPKEDDPNFEELVNEYYTLEAQLKSLTEQARNSEAALVEHAIALETLNELDRSNSESEVLVPLGRDNFVQAKISDTKNVLVSVGSNVVLKKPVGDAAKLSESKVRSYEQSLQALNTMITSIQQRLSDLGPKLEELSRKAGNKQ